MHYVLQKIQRKVFINNEVNISNQARQDAGMLMKLHAGRKSLPTGSPNCFLNSREQHVVERKVDSPSLYSFATLFILVLLSVVQASQTSKDCKHEQSVSSCWRIYFISSPHRPFAELRLRSH